MANIPTWSEMDRITLCLRVVEPGEVPCVGVE